MVLTIALACAALTAAALFALLQTGWARQIALDLPNERSLHSQAVPRSGGLALILVAALPALWVGGTLAALAAMALLLMVVSAIDDRAGLPAGVRLAVHLLLAVAATLLIHGMTSPLLAGFLVVAIIWSINAYNFMDGSDGMAGGMAAVGFGAYAVQASLMDHMPLAMAAAALAGSSLGFLCFNFAPARLFMGDGGSAPLGFLAAALGVLGWKAGVWSAWLPPLVFSAFLVDASVTLLRRLARGERIWLAHKEHLYQRMVAGGLGHTRTALVAYGIMAVSAGLALTTERVPPAMARSLAVAWLAACVLLHFVGVRRFSRT